MINEKKVREAIEIVRDIQRSCFDYGIGASPDEYSAKSLEILLLLASAVLSCEGWPEKKMGEPERSEFTGNCDDDYDSGYDRGSFFGFNEAIDLCLAAHAKAMLAKDKEIAELKAGNGCGGGWRYDQMRNCFVNQMGDVRS